MGGCGSTLHRLMGSRPTIVECCIGNIHIRPLIEQNPQNRSIIAKIDEIDFLIANTNQAKVHEDRSGECVSAYGWSWLLPYSFSHFLLPGTRTAADPRERPPRIIHQTTRFEPKICPLSSHHHLSPSPFCSDPQKLKIVGVERDFWLERYLLYLNKNPGGFYIIMAISAGPTREKHKFEIISGQFSSKLPKGRKPSQILWHHRTSCLTLER